MVFGDPKVFTSLMFQMCSFSFAWLCPYLFPQVYKPETQGILSLLETKYSFEDTKPIKNSHKRVLNLYSSMPCMMILLWNMCDDTQKLPRCTVDQVMKALEMILGNNFKE